MRKTVVFLLTVFIFSVLFSGLVLADVNSGAEADVRASNGDLVRVGSSVKDIGLVEGDLLVFADKVTAGGTTGGDRIFFARKINMAGVSQKDTRLVGGVINIGGSVKGNVSAAGGSINLDRFSRVEGNFLCFGGYADLEGSIAGSVRVIGGTVTIGGDIGGDVTAEGGRIVLKPGARIEGSLVYASPREAVIAEGVEVSEGIRYLTPPLGCRVIDIMQNGYGGISFYIIRQVMEFLSLLIIGVFLLKCFPVFTGAAAGHIFGGPKASLAQGVCFLFIAPAAAVLVMATIIGFPLGIMMLLGYAVMVFTSKVTVALWLGQTLTRGWDEHRTVPFIMGGVIISLLTTVPVLGWIVWFAVTAVGLGGIVSAYRNGVHLPVRKNISTNI